MADICIKCGGKGFHWRIQELHAHNTGEHLANLYKHGDTCVACRGYGHQRRDYSLAYIALIAFALLFFVWQLARVL